MECEAKPHEALRRSCKRNMYQDGLFITLEGGDGAGKSTLLRRLGERCQQAGRTPFLTREPGGCALAESVREVLLKDRQEGMSARAELLLYLAARAQNVEQNIAPALAAGNVVLCDRFNDSSIAYQGYGRRLPLEEVHRLCSFATNSLEPRLTLYLDLPPSEGLARVRKQRAEEGDRLEKQAIEFHERCREGFLALAQQHPQRIVVLDARRTPEALEEQAWTLLHPLL